VDWEQLIDHNDVNQSLGTWENYFRNPVYPRVFPKRKNLPWLSNNIPQPMQKMNNIYRRATLEQVQNNEKQSHSYAAEF